MALRGSRELRARLKAIRTVFKPVAKDWTEVVVIEARRRVPAASGKTRASIRRRNASQRKASVVGNYPINFIDAGTKAHDISPKKMSVLKFQDGGQTVFARKVHKRAQPARPFKKEAAAAGLQKVNIIGDLIELWNKAA